jgi:polyisoprenyl-teichoic acid--peptidoglycan teichoic acid transferase
MTKQRPTLDGFVPRRPGSQLGGHHAGAPTPPEAPQGLQMPSVEPTRHQPTTLRPSNTASIRSEIDESLRSIDTGDELPGGKKGRRRKNKKPQTRARRIVKWVSIALVVILVVVGAWLAYKALRASNNIFKGNIFDIIQSQPLKEDANGRSNILIFGTSEDDPEHGGADLTDSIMVVSVDQDKKNAFMISIPRDLYVEYGDVCPEGYRGKINSMYSCFAGEGDEAAGANALKAKVGEVLGLDIQYYTHLNYTAVRQSVDAVGGVDIKIESEDPRGILDRNFDWKCGYKCYFVNYKNGEVAHMDGEHALAFARARNASGGYGLPNGNFDREKNQQKVIQALREKAVSAGTLTNIGKVTGLIDALGDNIRTNFETKEIRTLMTLGNDIKSDAIKPVSLVEEGNMLVTTGNIGGASIVQPVAGLLDYGDIAAYVHKTLNATDVTREAAGVAVYNASGIGGMAQTQADKMSEKGMNILSVDNAPDGNYTGVEIYQIGEGKKATKAALEKMYSVKVKISTPPVSVAEGTNFVVIIAKDLSGN